MSPIANAAPGDIVVTNFGSYQHYSIISDRCDASGQFMLISATSRNGTVLEESFETVTQGKHSYIAKIESSLDAEQRLARARAQCQRWSYHLVNANCEHFAHWVLGEKAQSKQVKLALRGVSYGVTIASLILKKPSPTKLVLSAAGSALFALYKARAAKQHLEDDAHYYYGVDAV